MTVFQVFYKANYPLVLRACRRPISIYDLLFMIYDFRIASLRLPRSFDFAQDRCARNDETIALFLQRGGI